MVPENAIMQQLPQRKRRKLTYELDELASFPVPEPRYREAGAGSRLSTCQKWRTVMRNMIKLVAGTSFVAKGATTVAKSRGIGATTARKGAGGMSTSPQDVVAEKTMRETGIGDGIPPLTVIEGESGVRHPLRGCEGKDGEL